MIALEGIGIGISGLLPLQNNQKMVRDRRWISPDPMLREEVDQTGGEKIPIKSFTNTFITRLTIVPSQTHIDRGDIKKLMRGKQLSEIGTERISKCLFSPNLRAIESEV